MVAIHRAKPESFRMSSTMELVSWLSRLDPAALGWMAAMSPDLPMPWISLPANAPRYQATAQTGLGGFQKPREPVIASCHQAGCHASFPLAHAAVAEEVVAVHHGQLAEEELDGALAPAFLGTLALGGGETPSLLTARGHETERLRQSDRPAPAGVWWAARGCGEPGCPAECRRATPASHSGWSFHCSLLRDKPGSQREGSNSSQQNVHGLMSTKQCRNPLNSQWKFAPLLFWSSLYFIK